MSDDNEIERLNQGDDDHDEDEDSTDIDLSKEMFFTVDHTNSKPDVTEVALKVFGLAYMTLILAALTLRIFGRRK